MKIAPIIKEMRRLEHDFQASGEALIPPKFLCFGAAKTAERICNALPGQS
ncbi:MAG: hypothetical protein ABI954_02495 [Pyrinomonadaceae bacterium]